MQIVLVGFSGAGKSTVLGELALLLKSRGFSAHDLDTLTIAGHHSVSEMVAKVGWEKFRVAEAHALETVLSSGGSQILALGGGSLERGWPILERFSQAKVVYLDCPFSVCWERIRTDLIGRPLVRQGEAAMALLFEERRELFERARLRVDSTQKPQDVALAIVQLVGLA